MSKALFLWCLNASMTHIIRRKDVFIGITDIKQKIGAIAVTSEE
jgi:hypothetical protein